MSRITVVSTHQLNQLLPNEVAACLVGETYFRVIECNNSFNDIDDILSQKRVDVLISRVNGTSHLHRLRKIIQLNPGLKVVITGEKNRDIIFEYIKVGIKGHFEDGITPELLRRAIRVLHKGEVWFDREVSSMIMGLFANQNKSDSYAQKSSPLSDREAEVLECVSRGMKNRMISTTLHISESTVKTHLYKIYEKLGVKDRMSAVLKMKEW